MDRYIETRIIESKNDDILQYVNEAFGLIDRYFDLKANKKRDPKVEATLEKIDIRFQEIISKIAA